jgi:hypothetical protein
MGLRTVSVGRPSIGDGTQLLMPGLVGARSHGRGLSPIQKGVRTYRASFPEVLKNLLGIVPLGLLQEKPVGIATMGGSAQRHLAVDSIPITALSAKSITMDENSRATIGQAYFDVSARSVLSAPLYAAKSFARQKIFGHLIERVRFARTLRWRETDSNPRSPGYGELALSSPGDPSLFGGGRDTKLCRCELRE